MVADTPRSNPPVAFTLPASFQPTEFLTGRLAMRSDDARWLMSTILRKTANRDIDVWGCVRLDARVLRRVMDADNYPKIVGALENGGAIETANHQAGVKTKGYRLCKRFLGDHCVRMRATDPRLIERIRREQDRQDLEDHTDRWKPVHHALADDQKHVTITNDAEKILLDLPDHTRLCQDVLVSNIQHRQHSFSVGSTGRVFNSITGLKRDLRRTLRIDGSPVGCVDIRCAQPAMLAILLSQQGCLKYPPSVPISPATYKLSGSGGSGLALLLPSVPWSAGPDFASFASSVSDGSFYDVLCNLSGLDRDFVKLRFLVDVLAKRGRYPSSVEDVFSTAFPSVYQVIRKVNQNDHGELIRLLQMAESWLVVEKVAPRLMSTGCRTVTLHDAIFSAAESVPKVEAAFQDVLQEIGLTLSLKRDVA